MASENVFLHHFRIAKKKVERSIELQGGDHRRARLNFLERVTDAATCAEKARAIAPELEPHWGTDPVIERRLLLLINSVTQRDTSILESL